MFPTNYILFLQIILFLFITPGTPRIVIVSQAVNYGVNKCIWTALGDISANIIQMVLVVFVIGEFFSHNPQILNILKWLGTVYLFYLAYDIYNSKISSINKKKFYSKSIFSF
jgi:threonine/homoserine/homoserine lactone efflux protein